MKYSTIVGALLLATSAAAHAEVSLDAPWVRAMPPTQKMTAGYATLVNDSQQAITVVGARSPIARVAELHTTEARGDSMRMVPLTPVDIAPGEVFHFAPGGPHVMLMGVQQMPAAGSSVELCFTLASGDAICADAAVSRSAPEGSVDSDVHHH